MENQEILKEALLEEYWLKVLDNSHEPSLLTTFSQEQDSRQEESAGLTIALNPEDCKKIRALCNDSPVLIFNFYASAFSVLLRTYTESEALIFPSPYIQIENNTGKNDTLFLFKSTVDKSQGFKSLFSGNKEHLIHALNHSVSFDFLEKTLNKEDLEKLKEVSLVVRGINHKNTTYSPKLLAEVVENTNDPCLKITFQSNTLNSDFMKLLGHNFNHLLSRVLQQIYEPLDSIDFKSSKEHELLKSFNAVAPYFSLERNILELISDQVSAFPDKAAIWHKDQQISYEALDSRSNQLSGYLKEHHVMGEDVLVGVMMERSITMAESILGIWKSGGAYVPIDPNYPVERINQIITSSDLKILIVDSGVEKQQLSELAPELSIINMDAIRTELSALPSTSLDTTVNPDSLAYVIYTSGSTGTPKGVMIEHIGMLNHIGAKITEMSITPESIVAQNATHTFDISVWQMFSALLVGGTTVIYDHDTVLDPALFIKKTDQDKITTLELVPSYLTEMLEDLENNPDRKLFSDLEILILNAETLLPSMVKRWLVLYPDIPIVNTYGATEVSDDMSHYIMSSLPQTLTVPVMKKPIQHFEVHIVDEHLQQVPIGVKGEILLAGLAVGRGYLNAEALTKASFLKGPIAGVTQQERVYRTGDLGRYLPDGTMEFMGRKDTQVKIRGHRIELGEVEHVMGSISSIKNTKVIANEAEQYLVGYYVSQEALSREYLLEELRKKLPEYMLPGYFIWMKEFPLTSNGKIDTKALPSPEDLGMSAGAEYVAPRNETEEKLAAIWSEILDTDKIGIKDNFFEIGGHSLKATRLSSRIYKNFEVKLELRDLFTHTVLEDQARFIEQAKKTTYMNIIPVEEQESYELSSAQIRLWILSQFEDGNVAYNMPGVFEFEGILNIKALEKSFNSLVARHESLRTVFKEDEEGEVRQWIVSGEALGFTIDYRDYRETQHKEEQVKAYIEEDSQKPFDLEKGPLLRAGLFQITDDRHFIYFNMHHIIGDGWSMEVLVKELLILYNAYIKQEESPLLPLRIQYKDYAAWQQEQLKGKKLETHKQYWLEQFAGELPVLEMPIDKARAALKTYNGGMVIKTIEKTLAEKLRTITREKEGTLFMGLLTLVKMLLYKYSGQEDVIIGSPIAGREHTDLEDQIGFYISTLALRTTFSGSDSFTTLLHKIKQITLGAYEHQAYPYDELVDELDLVKDMSRSPLFDIMVVLQNTGVNIGTVAQNLEGIRVKPYEDIPHTISKFDITFNFTETTEDIQAYIEYNSDLYNRETIVQLSNHLVRLLEVIVQTPEQPIQTLDYLSDVEKNKLKSFNAVAPYFSLERNILELISDQVSVFPDKTALRHKDQQLSYEALDSRSNQLSGYLKEHHVMGEDVLVGLMMERSITMAESILGIWKSGGAYVPIDPNYPIERINQIIASSDLKILIVDSGVEKQQLSELAPELSIINMDAIRTELSALPSTSLDTTINPDSLAYVIYTSGSTGIPKGVMIEHIGMLNHMGAKITEMGIGRESIVAQNAAHTFDISVWQMFSALLVGGTTIIYDRDTVLDPALFIQKTDQDKITTLELVPSYLTEMLEDLENNPDRKLFSDLEILILNAETLLPSMVKRWLAMYPNIPIVNTYGATEVSDDMSHYIMHSCPETLTVPVMKKPIQHFEVHIVDQNLQLVPIGVKGEILLAGLAVGRGYLNAPELTKASFLKGPIAGVTQQERVYRTGDLGRYLPDGTMEFIGRKDTQVKIRGHRIELGEIEHVMGSISAVKNTKVIANEAEQYLVGYYVSQEALSREYLLEELRKKLPEYMLPSYFIWMKEFPLTPNGKIDTKALPSPEDLGMSAGAEYVAPRNETEEKLAAIWSEILDIDKDKIGIKDNFFEIGGHSLKATRLSSRIYKNFEVKLELRDLFTHTVLEDQARLIAEAKKTSYISIDPVGDQESYALSSAQTRLWILSQFEEDSVAYNVPFNLCLKGSFKLEVFKKAAAILVQRHESLRTVFVTIDGEPRQRILTELPDTYFTYYDYRNLGEVQQTEKSRSIFSDLAATVFDLEKGPIIKIVIVQIAAEEFYLFYNIHHIITDGWSEGIIASEIVHIYNSLLEGKNIKLNPIPFTYKDYAAWHNTLIQNNSFKSIKEYWINKLGDKPNGIELPTDHQRKTIQTFNGKTISFLIDTKEYAGIKQFCNRTNSTVNMFILSTLGVLMYNYSGQRDIIIGSPIAGRRNEELHHIIGFFVNTIVFRFKVDTFQTFKDVLGHVRNEAIETYDHQDYPFDLLVENLSLERDLSQSPLFNVMIAYNNTDLANNTMGLAGVTASETPFSDEINMSKFDLTFFIDNVDDDKLNVQIEYNSDLFERETIERMSKNYSLLINDAVNNPDLKIHQLQKLNESELEKLTNKFNNSKTSYQDVLIHQLFEEQVKLTPDRIAVVDKEGRKISYKALNLKANQLARYLRADLKVSRNDVIAISIDRSLEMIISILGIIKSGGAYLAIDPTYPKERIVYMLRDSRCNLVLTEKNKIEIFDDYVGNLIIYDDIQEEISGNSEADLSIVNTMDDLLYIIYTSGSTGTPNGAILSHGILSNLIHWHKNDALIDGSLRCLQFTSVNFCVSFQEIISTLCSGGELYLIGDIERQDVTYLREFLEKNRIENLYLPFSYLNFLFNEITVFGGEFKGSLKNIITAGEQLKITKNLRSFLLSNEGLKLHNHYGSSEMHVVTSCTIDAETIKADILPPVGKPITNTNIFILDDLGNLLPLGSWGEIGVLGSYDFKGYVNNKELTSKKLVNVPFLKDTGKIYRTGDIGRWRNDGQLQLKGRKDSQVKIRGFRVEPGEIESILLNIEGVKDSVVVVKSDKNNQKYLVAYIVLHGTTVEEIREELVGALPQYMIPKFVTLEALPLMPNGKVDRAELPEPVFDDDKTMYVAAETETQAKLVEIWQKALSLERIGIKDNFFEIGGHSLKATHVKSIIHKELHVKLDLIHMFQSPTIEKLAQIIDQLQKVEFFSIEKLEEHPHYALSPSQRRLWVLSQFKDGNIAYNMPGIYKFDGDLDDKALERAFRSLVARHEVLRTVFKEDETGDLRQFINPLKDEESFINYHDLRKDKHKKDVVRAMVQEEIEKPFDLTEEPLLRTQLLHIEEDKYVFIYVMHHIISDGWSMEVLIRELLTLYNAYSKGKENPLKPLRIQYKDYSAWQQQQLSGENIKIHKNYWLDQFSEEIPTLELPTDNLRPVVKTYNGGVVKQTISKELTRKLKKATQQEEATLFMGLLAVIKTLLYKYTRQEDIIVGSPIAGREHTDLEDQIGFYINTLALRTQFSGADSYRKLLNNIKQVTLGAYEHQIYPFDELIDELNLTRDTSRSALFDVMAVLQNTDINNKEEQNLDNIQVQEYEEGEQVMSIFDLLFNFVETPQGIETSIEYNSDLFNKETVEQLSNHFIQLLEATIESPEQPISKLAYLSEAERHILLKDFNTTTIDYSKEKTIIQLFEEQAAKTPENVAVVFQNKKLTYRELNEQANQMASYLQSSYNIKSDDLVGMKLERSHWMIITILGILKSGGAYVPIDPTYPEERINYMVEDCKCKVLVDEKELSKFKRDQHKYIKDNYPSDTTSDNLVYVIYTSGTTGQPKGIMMRHNSMVNLMNHHKKDIIQSNIKSVLQFASISFDVSFQEIFSTLTHGLSLYIIDEDYRKDVEKFGKFIKENCIDTLFLPTSYFNLLQDHESFIDQINTSVRNIYVVGEKLVLKESFINKFRLSPFQIYNHYGPTETHVVTAYKLNKTEKEYNYIPPIGSPIDNTEIYIIDNVKMLTPIGITGEICIGGDALSKGYLNKPEVTGEKFIPNPFREGEIIYRTGDLGCWLPDGNIAFLGRKDNQVKIRGYRVELREIESVLQKHESVETAIVLDKDDNQGDTNLIAYIISKQELNSAALRSYLKSLLPDYMIPSYFLQIKQLPLTRNGKVDKKSLPDPEDLGISSGIAYEAPGNEIEEKLVAIWEDILGKDKIGVKDNFFELGGHSIKAIKVISEVQRAFNVKIDIARLFHEPNIAELAIEIANQSWLNEKIDENKIIDKTII